MVELIQGDCLEKMKDIERETIDMILTDPPYEATACSWDSIIDLDLMWMQLKRIVKPNGVIVIMSTQPFTTTLISSNIEMFKYCWYWKRSKISAFIQAKRKPLNIIEIICIFTKEIISRSIYNPQNIKSIDKFLKDQGYRHQFGNRKPTKYRQKITNYPTQLLDIKSEGNPIHPTQKPVALMEYLIKTYTNKNQIVLDFTMGSGTTGVAAVNLDRNFIGIELDKEYFKIAENKINEAIESKRPKCLNCSNFGFADNFKMICTYKSGCYIIPKEIRKIGCKFHNES